MRVFLVLLFIVSTSFGQQFVETGSLPIDFIYDVKTSSETPGVAYVSGGNSTYIVDVSNSTNPSLLATFNAPGSALGVSESKYIGGYIYVSSSSFYLVSASDLNNLTIVLTIAPVGNGSFVLSSLVVDQQYLYLFEENCVAVYNISNLSNVSMLSAVCTPNAVQSIGTATQRGDYLYATNFAYLGNLADNLIVLNITNRTAPAVVYFSQALNDTNQFGVGLYEDYILYATNSTLNVALFQTNVSNPMPDIISSLYIPSDTPAFDYAPQMYGNIAIIALDDGLVLVDLSNPSSPMYLGRFLNGTTFYSIAFANNNNTIVLTDITSNQLILGEIVSNATTTSSATTSRATTSQATTSQTGSTTSRSTTSKSSTAQATTESHASASSSLHQTLMMITALVAIALLFV